VTLIEDLIEQRFIDELPERIIGDAAYDSDGLDSRLADRDIEMIAPNRSNRRHKTQDGRPMRRYRRRWMIERVFAWLQGFRRITTRYEFHAPNFLGFVQLGCVLILLRNSLRLD